jgi:hypothetical protein
VVAFADDEIEAAVRDQIEGGRLLRQLCQDKVIIVEQSRSGVVSTIK